MLKIHGEAKGPVTDLKLENNQLRGTVEIEIEKFQTGITLRDQHMKEKYLQAKEFPRARLSITEAAVDGDFTKSLNLTGEKPFRGKLSLHGKEQDVVGTFQVKEGLVQAKFPISLQDYSIEVPKYLGITVANTVDVSAEFPLLKE